MMTGKKKPGLIPALRGRKISEFEASLGLQREFQDSQGYTENPCLEKTTKKSFISLFKNLNKVNVCNYKYYFVKFILK